MTGPLGVVLLTLAQMACLTDAVSPTQTQSEHSALLNARPGEVTDPLPPGKHPLGLWRR